MTEITLKSKKWPKMLWNIKNDQNTLILFHIRWHRFIYLFIYLFFFFFFTFDNFIILGSINNTCDYNFITFDGSLIFFLTFNLHLMVENWRTQHKNLSIAKAESNQNWNTLFLLLWVLLRVLFSSRGFGREEAYREKKRRDQRDRSIERVRD